MERRGKKLLRPGAVAAINDVEGVQAAAAALPEISNTWPSDGDGVGARVEREARASALGGRERERSYCGLEDKTKNKWAS